MMKIIWAVFIFLSHLRHTSGSNREHYQDEDDEDFCEMVAEKPMYYMGCSMLPPTAGHLLPHPLYCTMFIECLNQKTSVIKCCPAMGGGYSGRLWFNPGNSLCDYPETFPSNCTVPVANISTTKETFTTSSITTSPSTTGQTTTLSRSLTISPVSTCPQIGRCFAVDARNVTWEGTYGETVKKACGNRIPERRLATWFCVFEGAQPDRSECVDRWIQDIGDEVRGIIIVFYILMNTSATRYGIPILLLQTSLNSLKEI